VLKLILQPLVENAIEHGLIPKGACGNIWISAEADRNELILRIADDGVGITSDRLQEIKKKLDGLREERFDDEMLLAGHVGLVNVSQRLYLNYGELGRLSIESNQQAGTVVEIHLPIDKEMEVRSDV
jgi:two-component system sensor histidine kinase YesM